MKTRKIFLPLVAVTLLLSGCGIYTSYHRAENLPVDGLYRDTAARSGSLASDTANFGNTPWREVFTDPHLQSLIGIALERNVNLQTAYLRICEAEANYLPAKMAFLPQLSFAPQGTVSSFDGGKATQTYQLPVQAGWQLDIFGSLRNAKEMAKANVLQSRAYRQAVQTQLIASVANLYYTLLMLDEQLRITHETAALWKDNVEAMKAMQTYTSNVTSAAVAQTEANYYQILASVPALEQNLRETENGLALLLREPPHTIARGAIASQSFPAELSAGVPMQLLANRPDVQAAEMTLRIAFYATNYARSQFYPQITLGGSAGWTNSAGSAIFNPARFIASAVGSLTQPLFRNGLLIGKLKAAKAQQEAASLAFEQALLKAGTEVSNALFQYQTTLEKAAARQQQVVLLEKAEEATAALFQLSNSSYIEKLTAQQSLLSARLALVSESYNRYQSVISLYAALGGGRE